MAGRSAHAPAAEACLDSRQRLLAAAWELLWLNSYATVSVDDLCRRADVNKGSFYHHFDSKAALAQAAFAQQWECLRPALDAIFSAQVPPLERIDRYAALGLEIQTAKAQEFGRVLGCPWTSLGCEAGCKDGDLRSIAAQKGERVSRYLAAAIRDAIALGQIPAGDPDELAAMCQALITGSAAQARITDSLQPFARLAGALRRLLGAPAT
ncbi:MAG: TetR/AcrR family transcriptional regulator [Planctomycetes bacterium]|nr:TetR/AcrR family transcriptional regulator [Planctomycetota bacterium]